MTNITIEPSTRRSLHDSGIDNLIVEVKVKKGERGSVYLYDAQASVTWDGCTDALEPKSLRGIERLSFHDLKVTWNKLSDSSPALSLTPGEETVFSALFQVPKDATCYVEVVFLGGRHFSPRCGQWRASIISPPPSAKAVSTAAGRS